MYVCIYICICSLFNGRKVRAAPQQQPQQQRVTTDSWFCMNTCTSAPCSPAPLLPADNFTVRCIFCCCTQQLNESQQIYVLTGVYTYICMYLSLWTIHFGIKYKFLHALHYTCSHKHRCIHMHYCMFSLVYASI